MMAEDDGIEISWCKQYQGLIAFDGFSLGVVIGETQIFQALSPSGKGGGIQDDAIVLGGLEPLQPAPQKTEEASVKRPPNSILLA